MQTTAGPSPESIMKKVHEVIAAYNRHELGPYLSLLAPDFVAYDPVYPGPIKEIQTIRKAHERNFEAFPDLRMENLSLAVTGDVMAGEDVLSGTFKMPLKLPLGIVPPTGKRIEVRYALFSRLNSNGLVLDQRMYIYDLPGFFKQLGIKT